MTKRGSSAQPSARRVYARKPGGGRQTGETRQFIQFLACGTAFVLLVAAKLLSPGHAMPLRETLRGMMERNIDVEAVFSAVGSAFAGSDSVPETAERVYEVVFGAQEVTASESGSAAVSPPDADSASETAAASETELPAASETALNSAVDSAPVLRADTLREGAALESLREYRPSAGLGAPVGGGVVSMGKSGIGDAGADDAKSGLDSTPQTGAPSEIPQDTVSGQQDTPSGPQPEADPAGADSSGMDPALKDGGTDESAILYSTRNLPDGVSMEQAILNFDYAAPVPGTITSGFGFRIHPISGTLRFHYGVDLAAEEGSDVLCFADGIVSAVGRSSSYGNYCTVDHGGGFSTLYAHCQRVAVSAGEAVSLGQNIAAAGATGQATGPHLHFELQRGGVYLNPVYYVS